MNLFENVFRLTHLRNKRKWESATAVFTGKCERAIVRTKMGPRPAKYNAYEVVYEANGVKRNGWYTFHPLDDPDPQSIAGDKLKTDTEKINPLSLRWIYQTFRTLAASVRISPCVTSRQTVLGEV